VLFSCGKPELSRNINNRSVVDYQCWPDDCNEGSFGIDLAVKNFVFDLSDCISPPPLIGCTISSPESNFVGISTFGCLYDNTHEIILTGPTAFEILPDCLPPRYDIDLDCVSDQIIEQYTPYILWLYLEDFEFEADITIVTQYYKQLCVSYCTVSSPWLRIEMVECGDSYACCVTETKWVKNENDYYPVETTTSITGECSGGPDTSCPNGGKKGDIISLPFNPQSLSTPCAPRYCYLP